MPRWFETVRRAFLLDFQMPDSADQMPIGQRRNLRDIDPARIVRQLHDAGVQALYTHAKDNQGNAYYDTHYGHKHTGIGDRDLMADFSRECRKVGMTILYYVQLSRERRGALEPMYAARTEDGEPFVMTGDKPLQPSEEVRPVICLNGPAREYLKNVTRELAERYDFDGYWLDCFAWWGAFAMPCYCPYCRHTFRMDTGGELPAADDKTSGAWRRYYLWRMRLNARVMREITCGIRTANPKLTITHNPLYHTPAWTFLEADGDDYVSHEFHFDEGFGTLALTCRQNDAMRPGVPFEIETWRFANRLRGPRPMLRGYQVRPVVQLFTEMATVLANGGFTQYYDQINTDGTLDEASLDVMKGAFDLLKQREPFVDFSLPRQDYAAVVWSAQNDGLNPPPWQQTHAHELEGFHLALCETHLPHRLIRDIDLSPERLKGVTVLVLPNVMLLSEAMCDAIRAYVKNGGGLVATFRSSLCDEVGNPLDNFRLADVFGCDYVEMFGYSSGFVKFEKNEPLSIDLRPGFPMTLYNKFMTKVLPRDGATGVGRQVNPMRGMHMGNPPQETTPYPAAVCNTFGNGRVIYLTPQLGDCYQDYGHPDYRTMLRNAVLHAAGEPPAVRLEGPATVECVPWGTPGSRQIVHLVNRTPAGPMRTKGSVITEAIPVHGLKLTFAGQIKTARLEPDGVDLNVEESDAGSVVRIPRLDVHAMVIAE